MTGAAAARPAFAIASRAEAFRLAWPLLAMLFAQVGLFVWTAPRGLDLTDESYYLLSYLHWRELSATVTFFGAYFEAPFRLLGQHVASIRVFGFALLVGAGGFFTWRALTFARVEPASRPVPALPFVVCGMVAPLFYYIYGTTLRAPSYNLLVLFCMLVASGLLLYVIEGRGSRRQKATAAFGYGVALGACALGKATSAVAVALCHGVFFALYYRRGHGIALMALALAGAALNFVVLQLLQPRWFEVLGEGVALTVTLDGRYASVPLASLWEAVLRGAERMLPAFVVITLAFVALVRRWGKGRPAVLSWLVVLLISATMLMVQREGYGKSWWALLVFGTALLWLAEWLCRPAMLPTGAISHELGLSILLFTLPVAYSIGTNGSLPAHTEMAAAFGIVAMMLPLRRLAAQAQVRPAALSVALLVLCVPTLVSQLRSLSDPSFTYRLRVGVSEQQSPVSLGAAGDILLVDATTRDGLEALDRAMRDAGYKTGEAVLDVTGDGPGLVYALGGRPVGVAWLIGGYPGSERAAARVFGDVPAQTLRQAWLISADDNPRALRTWAALLRERAGDGSHVLAGKVLYRAQPRWDTVSAKPLMLSLWKPTLADRPMPERAP